MPFWYESQPVWGWVYNFADLLLIYQHQLHNGGGLVKNVDDFLGKSKHCYKDGIYRSEFGTRREHTGQTLRGFLQYWNCLDLFIQLANEIKCTT